MRMACVFNLIVMAAVSAATDATVSALAQTHGTRVPPPE
jgi:hypothetical protein